MASFLSVFGFLLLCIADAFALFSMTGQVDSVGTVSLNTAVAIHVGVGIFAAAIVSLKTRGRKGGGTLTILAGLISLMTPVLGCLVAAWLSRRPRSARQKSNSIAEMRLGNPLAESDESPRSLLFSKPLAAELQNQNHELLRQATPRIRLIPDRKALILLQELNELPDARTHLFAQAAVATIFGHRERRLEVLREFVNRELDSRDALAGHERLATALVHEADLNSERSGPLIQEAAENYKKALEKEPGDAACLFGLANCLIRLEEHSEAATIYTKLVSVDSSSQFAPRLAASFAAASGAWSDAAQEAGRLNLSSSARQFWNS